MAISFTVDPEAAEQHGLGLKYEVHGAYHLAHDQFFEAARTLKRSGLAQRDKPSTTLQLAHIQRDDGFTLTREAIATTKASQANLLLFNSYRKTVGSEVAINSLLNQGVEAFTPEAWALLQSEYGATLGHAYRIAVVNHLLFSDAVTVISKPELFTDGPAEMNAWQYLSRGSNRYYAANFAMNAARYETTQAHRRQAGLWVTRAAMQLPTALAHDRPNLLDTTLTLGGRLPHVLGGPQHALDLIRTKP